MEIPTANEVALIAKKVADYGAQIAAVLHTHSLTAERVPRDFEGSINILDSTVTTLRQALDLLNEEAAHKGQKLFSEEGIKYVHLLTTECATTLAKIEPLLVKATLTPTEAREKRKLERKAVAEKGKPKVDPLQLRLDDKAFLEIVETAKWSRILSEMEEEVVNNLYDLQLHLFIIVQVVKVGSLSRDLSSGEVDVKSIVAYHERITRTADLVGIKPPTGSSTNRRHKHDSSSSDDDSSTNSDSSIDLWTAKRKIKTMKKKLARPAPPPPPPPPPGFGRGWPGMGPPPPPLSAPPIEPKPYPPPSVNLGGDGVKLPQVEASPKTQTNPPSYAESHSSPASTTPTSTGPSIVAKTHIKKRKAPLPVTYPAEKGKGEAVEEEKKPLTLEPRLFKSNTNSLGFKLKTIFRSKASLAEEMRKTLADSESRLLAFVLRGHDSKQVPHSAFHSLEATHMRTILSQLNDNSWYRTFTSLSFVENQTLACVLRPFNGGLGHPPRDVVVLKVIERESRGGWGVLLRDLCARSPQGEQRAILAIVRETTEERSPAVGPGHPVFNGCGPPPPPPGPGGPIPKFVRPPPGLPNPARSNSRTSDLRFPPSPNVPVGWHVSWPPPQFGRPGPPPPPEPVATDADFERALTVYTEYTLRQIESVEEPGPHHSWSRVSVVQESNERQDILHRINKFALQRGNIIELKLRLSEQQNSQVNRLMNELQSMERDVRFEWSWAEMSLYTHAGIIAYRNLVDYGRDVSSNLAPAATHMHLIAKRTLRSHCEPRKVYRQFVHPPPGPPPFGRPGGPGPGPPIILNKPGVIKVHPERRRSSRYSSDSDSGSGSGSDSDRSEGEVRRRLRRYKARRAKRDWNTRSRSPMSSDYSGSNSSDSEEEEEESVFKIKVQLKRGGDVVKSLLELWTPRIEGKGKGKEII